MRLVMTSVHFIAYFCDTHWSLSFLAHSQMKEILLGCSGLSHILTLDMPAWEDSNAFIALAVSYIQYVMIL